MSANCGQLNRNEDSEVMVRQVNLAAAFHDHISCTKMSQHSIGTGICGLQSADMSNQQNATVGSELSAAFESDHMYATESKPYNDSSVSANGCIVRPNSLFNNSQSEERNQISKLTEMILGQLDLIQHQQEQLLKKDRQLQGLKQDREALCLRLEKMEKRIAVLSAKVANNAAQAVVNNNVNSISVNANSNTANVNRTVVNKNSQTVSVGVETDCDQSSDTVVDEAGGGQTQFTDNAGFTKLYSHSSAVNSSVNSVNKSTITAKPRPLSQTSAVAVTKVKSEPQDTVESEKSCSTTTGSTKTARKSRKRQPKEVVPTSTSLPSTVTSPQKRSKPSVSSEIAANEEKREILSAKETSCDSLSTSQTTSNLNKTLTKKKVAKTKSETSSRVDFPTSASLCLKTVTKDVLMTSKPYPIAVNINQSQLEPLSDSDFSVDKSECEDREPTSDDDVIEVPSWRLHPVSSCYSLEGTENLDDEVFNRRHLKLENDEKRRKRWDIQRLREHRYNEKLRTGRYYNQSLTGSNCFVEKPSDLKKRASLDFDSFYPEIKNLQFIEVAEKIPVIAFGHPIPKLPLNTFSLPWNASQKPSATAPKERKSGKTC